MSHKTNAWTINTLIKTIVANLRTRLLLVMLAPFLLTLPLLDSTASTQQPAQDRVERFRKMSADAEAKGLAEPFKGITTNGQVVPGLFGIHSTGVSTEPVRKAADAFLSSLSVEQRAIISSTTMPAERLDTSGDRRTFDG